MQVKRQREEVELSRQFRPVRVTERRASRETRRACAAVCAGLEGLQMSEEEFWKKRDAAKRKES